MRVVIAGGHGKIGIELTRLLAGRGAAVRSLIRDPAQSDDVTEAGAEPAHCDLERSSVGEVAEAVGEADAVVFAAGAGPGSGAERKETMDLGGAVKLIEAARRNGIPRYVMISSMGADADHRGEEVFDVYLRAKGRADRALRDSGLDYTIVRPGRLTDDAPGGEITAAEHTERGEISRADVAAVLAEVLLEGRGRGTTFEVVGGEQPIEKALAEL